MAARLKLRHQEDIKAKIQASQLVNMLQEQALTGLYQGNEVSPVRVDAAKFLLNKVISTAPTISEVSGPDGGGIPLNLNVRFK